MCQTLDEVGRAPALPVSRFAGGAVGVSTGASAALGSGQWSVASKRGLGEGKRGLYKTKNYNSAWVLVNAILGHVGWVFSKKGSS